MLNKEQAAAAAEALLAPGTSERVERYEAMSRGISRAFRSNYLSQLASPRQLELVAEASRTGWPKVQIGIFMICVLWLTALIGYATWSLRLPLLSVLAIPAFYGLFHLFSTACIRARLQELLLREFEATSSRGT
jgi:hypothetical protein